MLSAIIPVKNGRTHIAGAIESVRSDETEVIVVDDDSSDATFEYVASTWPDVKVLRSEAAGPSAARNTGARAANGRWLAFLDSDDRALRGWGRALTSERCAGLVTVGAYIRKVNIVEVVEPGWIVGTSDGIGTKFLPGTYAVRSDVFAAVGGYDETLWYAEHTELAWRLRDECDRRKLPIHRVQQPLVLIDQPVVGLPRSLHYAERRAKACRHMMQKHPTRFASDPAGRRTYFRILAVAEQQQGHYLKAAAAATRAWATGFPYPRS